MGKVLISHDISFHKQHFENARQIYEYRKKYIAITQMIWIKKQPYVGKLGLTDTSALIMITLN